MSTSWGGMAAGDNMVYPVQTVDGQLASRCPQLATWISEHVPPVTWDTCHEDTDLQGPRLRRLHLTRNSVRCVTGDCVWTPLSPEDGHQPSSDVSDQASSVFSLGVLHTVAPYDSDSDRDPRLAQCYTNCLLVAASRTEATNFSIVTCLLGTGVKGIDRAHCAGILRGCLDNEEDILGDKECSVELVLQSEQILSEVLPAF